MGAKAAKPLAAKPLTTEDRAVAAEERAAGMLAVLRDPQPGEARERLPDAEWERLQREHLAAKQEAAGLRAEIEHAARAKRGRVAAPLWNEWQRLAWIAWRDPALVDRYASARLRGGAQGAAQRWAADTLYPGSEAASRARAEDVKAARAELDAWNPKGRPQLSAAAIRKRWPRMTVAAFRAQVEAAGQPVDKEPFVAACVKATGIERAAARDLYRSLPLALKQPQGRPRTKK